MIDCLYLLVIGKHCFSNERLVHHVRVCTYYLYTPFRLSVIVGSHSMVLKLDKKADRSIVFIIISQRLLIKYTLFNQSERIALACTDDT